MGPSLTLIRNATLLLDVAGGKLLVDPMLNAPGSVGPVGSTAPALANPLVPLPRTAEHWAGAASAVLVTHLHNDHFDAAARELLPPDIPVFCQPPDRERLAGDGFRHVVAVDREHPDLVPGAVVTRVPARHTIGMHEDALGPGSGYVLTGGGPTIYIAGDCVWSEELTRAVDEFAPDVIVVNGGAARFLTGPPISMTSEDVIRTARYAEEARIVVVHLEALNHCPMTRDELRRHLTAAGLAGRVEVPADGERLLL